MKKTLKLLLVMGLMAIMLPQISNAATRTYTIPDGAVGISETTYQQLKNAEYTDIEHYDQILYQYQNKIVFRADHFGEMYRVPFVGEKPYNPTRYLPDGVYKVGDNYFLLSDGKRLKLKADDYYNTIYSHVINGELKYYGLSTAEKTLMFSGTTEGDVLQQTMIGKIVMLVEDDGGLYYVGTDENGGVLYPLHGVEAIEGFIQSQAITVKSVLMKQIPKHDQYQDIVYTNSTYGFTLIFPETWKGYTVRIETYDGVTLGTYSSVHFGFPAQDSLFFVSILSKSQWADLQSEDVPMPTYLGENNQSVFAYDTTLEIANETMGDRMAEFEDIIKTFYNTNAVEETTAITTDKTSYQVDDPIVVTYKIVGELGDGAWLGLIPPAVTGSTEEAADAKDVEYKYLDGSLSGIMTFRGTHVPGKYQFRAFSSDGESATQLGISETITITE